MDITVNDLRLYAYCPRLYFKWKNKVTEERAGKFLTSLNPYEKLLWNSFLFCFQTEMRTGYLTTWTSLSRYLWKNGIQKFKKINYTRYSALYNLFKLYTSISSTESSPIAVNFPYEFQVSEGASVVGSIPVVVGKFPSSYSIVMMHQPSLHKSIEIRAAATAISLTLSASPKVIYAIGIPNEMAGQPEYKEIWPGAGYISDAQMYIKNIAKGIVEKREYYNEFGCPNCWFFKECRL